MEGFDTMGGRLARIIVDLNGGIVGRPLDESNGFPKIHGIIGDNGGYTHVIQLFHHLIPQVHIQQILMDIPRDRPLFFQ